MALPENLHLYDVFSLQYTTQASWDDMVLLLVFGISLAISLALIARYMTSPWRKMPSGPPGLPIIGNVLQLKDGQWIRFSDWRKVYGALDHVVCHDKNNANHHPFQAMSFL